MIKYFFPFCNKKNMSSSTQSPHPLTIKGYKEYKKWDSTKKAGENTFPPASAQSELDDDHTANQVVNLLANQQPVKPA